MAAGSHVTPPAGGRIALRDGRLEVPDRPVIPFVEGDGTGPDIWRATERVLDAAVERAYRGTRKLVWFEVYAGEKAYNRCKTWLPEATVEAFRTYLVGLKGPLTTPVGQGITSLNVALRQLLDLYVCLRPVRHFSGVPSPVKRPEDVDVVIFRENTEDIYAGIEFQEGTAETERFKALLRDAFPERFQKIRFPASCGLGLKPISREGTERLVRAAIAFALRCGRRSLTLVHKGNIMKFTEGAFKSWGYALAAREFRDSTVSERESWVLANRERDGDLSAEDNARQLEPGYDAMPPERQAALRAEVEEVLRALWKTHGGGRWKRMLLIRDAIADITLQQVLTRPREFDVVATMNLNGDYLSDALAAQVGGIGIAPGGNINYETGHAIFEATHGTAPKYANQDRVNPGSLILSGEMMLRHLGWDEAAELILHGLDRTLAAKRVTYDFERQMQGATLLRCSEFGEEIVRNM